MAGYKIDYQFDREKVLRMLGSYEGRDHLQDPMRNFLLALYKNPRYLYDPHALGAEMQIFLNAEAEEFAEEQKLVELD